jgi:hypothetical protein
MIVLTPIIIVIAYRFTNKKDIAIWSTLTFIINALIFIFLNVCRIIKRKEYDSKDLIPIISMLGIMMFLLIWENRSRYLVNFIPIMLIAQINGIEYLSDRMFEKKREDEKK